MTQQFYSQENSTQEKRKQAYSLCLHANVHSIQNNQKVETTQMPISWRMDKQNVYTWNGMLFGLKKKEVLMLSLSFL